MTDSMHQDRSIHRVRLPGTRMTAIAYVLGFIINFMVVLGALHDQITLPGPAGWLAIFNVGVLHIFMIRLYLWVFSKTMSFRRLARLIMHPAIAWKATWILSIPTWVGSLVMAGYYQRYFQPPIEEWIFGIIFLSPAAVATWVSLVFYLTDVEEGNTPMSRALERFGILKSQQGED